MAENDLQPDATDSSASLSASRHLKPWAKGQSGNPGGKSKKLEEIRSLAKDRSRRALERIIELVESQDEKVALMASKEVLDRAFGKATQPTEATVSFAGEFEAFIRELNERRAAKKIAPREPSEQEKFILKLNERRRREAETRSRLENPKPNSAGRWAPLWGESGARDGS